ncbi:MAG TPA: N-acetylmuramoyl-L-alanine amidase [bacterium]|nr:N-acetylmuramoyl-L-alanine amidase [bacterium]HMY34574.1 N-acetylmuramoyl-L-alanine amidase [bacterium]HMZ05085.1 N-acetylmuramoyl-L-alanine amidase [bacterium]HNB55977.1 N-acetylmuramoyl-L-alanine amidase [bacterium]HNC47775.1 N-acetylmuramoyl-L-alanine amidase [bacterium]
MKPLYHIFFCTIIAASIGGVIALAQAPMKLSYGTANKEVIPVFTGDQEYVSIKDVIALLDAGFFENTAKKKMVFTSNQHQFKVTGLNAFVVVDEKTTLQMPVTTQYIDGAIFVPAVYFFSAINAYLSTPVVINGEKIIAKSAPAIKDTIKTSAVSISPNLKDVIFEKKKNGLLMRIKTDGRFQSSDVEIWRNKNWLYVTVSGGYHSDLLAKDIKLSEQYKLIKEALIFQHKNSTQFSFQLNSDIAGYDISVDDKKDEIYVAWRIHQSSDLEFDNGGSGTGAIDKDQWKINKIVIDAGHGGKDHGASGKGGTKEKDITLNIALKVGKIIAERLKIPVEYTRDTDTYITLKGRTQFANQKNAKLFVSIHCNSNKSRKAHGFEIFFLSPSRNAEALAVARKENEVIDMEDDKHHYGDFTDEKFILANIMQSVFVKESEELASYVSKGIDKQVDITNRGVTQAPFYVLMGASMPSILVETAFISNPDEEKFLKSEAGQKKLSEGIVDGIKTFIDIYERSN